MGPDGKSYYRTYGLAADHNVTLTIDGMSDDADIMEYNADSTFTSDPTPRSADMPFYGRTMVEVCYNSSWGTADLYFAVDGSYTTDGAAFSVTIRSLGDAVGTFQNYGSPTDPYPFPQGYQSNSQIAGGGPSYYKVETTPGTSYRFNVSQALDITVYSDLFSTLVGGPAQNCGPIAAGGTYLYFTITGPGDSFIQAEVVNGEGTTSNPIPLFVEKVNYTQVDHTSSYYLFGVESGSSYTVSVTGMMDNVDVYLFDSGNFTNLEASGTKTGTSDESCNIITSGAMITIRIDNAASPKYGASFLLTVTRD